MNARTIKTKTATESEHHVEEPKGAWEMTLLLFALLGLILAIITMVYFVFFR